MVDDRRVQHDLDLVVMKNNGKNSVRDPYDGLHLDKIITFREMKTTFLSHIRKNLLWSSKRVGGDINLRSLEINT